MNRKLTWTELDCGIDIYLWFLHGDRFTLNPGLFLNMHATQCRKLRPACGKLGPAAVATAHVNSDGVARDRIAPANDADAAVQDDKHGVAVQLREGERDGGVVRGVREGHEQYEVDRRHERCEHARLDDELDELRDQRVRSGHLGVPPKKLERRSGITPLSRPKFRLTRYVMQAAMMISHVALPASQIWDAVSDGVVCWERGGTHRAAQEGLRRKVCEFPDDEELGALCDGSRALHQSNLHHNLVGERYRKLAATYNADTGSEPPGARQDGDAVGIVHLHRATHYDII